MLKLLVLSPYLKPIGISKTDRDDMFIWSQYNRRVYKVKSEYQLLAKGTQHNTHTSTNSEQIWKSLWRLKIPFRLIILLWEILNNALPIILCFERRNIVIDKVCVLYHLEEQDLDHLFLPCSFAKALWMGLAIIKIRPVTTKIIHSLVKAMAARH